MSPPSVCFSCEPQPTPEMGREKDFFPVTEKDIFLREKIAMWGMQSW